MTNAAVMSTSFRTSPWKILLVDDEPDIHDVTKLTLHRFELDGRRLQFFDAYSGPEAKEILSREPDIALVFLDVVMETEDAGLEVARWMRQDLKNQFTLTIGHLKTSRLFHCKNIAISTQSGESRGE